MSLNSHGLPSRVPVLAEMGRLFADPQLSDDDKQLALQLLQQDHADLDEVEVHAALWAIAQFGPSDAAAACLLACAPAWLASEDAATLWLDAYLATGGHHSTPGAAAAFEQLQALAASDTGLAEHLRRLGIG